MGVLSTIYQFLTKDSPVTIDASYTPNGVDRRFLDNQIQGIQQHLIDSLIQSRHATWFRTTATLNVGDVACSAGSLASDAFQLITLATPTPLAAAGQPLGVVLVGAGAGALALVAIAGALPPSITQLGSTSGIVRVSTTGRPERVASISAADVRLGAVDAAGMLTIAPSPIPSLVGAGGVGLSLVATGAIAQSAAVRTSTSGTVSVATTKLKTTPFAGISLQALTNGVAGAIQVAGPLNPSVLNLGGGVATAVGVNASGIPVRATDATCASPLNWIGFCDAGGNITIQPTQRRAYNPLDYGCPWDHAGDDLPGLQAMMATIPVGTADMARIELPPGMGYCSDNLVVKKIATWHGSGGGNDNLASGITFAPGKGILLLEYYSAGKTGDKSDYSRFRDISIESKSMLDGTQIGAAGAGEFGFSGINTWGAGVAYPKGAVVTRGAAPNLICCFRAQNAGVAGGSEPAGFATSSAAGAWVSGAKPGDLITDNAGPNQIVWMAEGYASGPHASGASVGDRLNSTAYVVGQRHKVPGDCRYTYRCVIAGTTASSQGSLYDTPAYFGDLGAITTTPPPSKTVSGSAAGSLIPFTSIACVKLTVVAHNFSEGDGVQGTGILGTVEANAFSIIHVVDVDHIELTTIPFVTGWSAGGTQLVWDYSKMLPAQTYPQGPIVDGSAQFLAECHSGFVVMSQYVRIENCYIQNFTCQAIHFVSNDSLGPNCDFCIVDNVAAGYCGMGIYITGFNSNVIRVSKFTCFEQGYGHTIKDSNVGAGSHIIWDRSLKNVFEYCYSQNIVGPNYRNDGNAASVLIGCNGESAYGDLFQSTNGTVVIGTSGPINPLSVNVTLIGQVGAAEGLLTKSRTLGTQPIFGAGFVNVTGQEVANPHTVQSTDIYTYIADEYQANRSGSGSIDVRPAVAGSGWWARLGMPTFTRLMTGESQSQAAEGPFHVRDYWGRFNGLASPYYRGVELTALRDNQIRGGKRIVGDRFSFANPGVSGAYDEIVCSTAGYVGLPWYSPVGAAISFPDLSVTLAGVLGTMVEPTANIVGAAVSGQSGLAATISNVTAGVATLTGLTGMSQASSVGHVLTLTNCARQENNGSYLIVAWISATSVKVAAPFSIQVDGNNGSLHWAEALPSGFVLPGSLGVLPAAGKKVFKCTGRTGDGLRGTTEPNWSTATVVGVDTVTDNHVTWTLWGFTPEWSFSSPADDRVTKTTGQARLLSIDGPMTDPNTAAPKSAVGKIERADAKTTTNAALQTIFTIDNGLFSKPSIAGNLVDNAAYTVDVTITGKSPGTNTEVGSVHLTGDFYMNGGASLVRVGADVNVPRFVSGSVAALTISSKTLLVQVTPGINATVQWTIAGSVIRKSD